MSDLAGGELVSDFVDDKTIIAPARSSSEQLNALEASRDAFGCRRASGLTTTFDNGVPLEAPLTAARKGALAAKRVIDVVVGGLALISLSPLMVAVAVLIRMTSPGPAMFRQDRDGADGRVISVYKFRSMYVDKGDVTGVHQTREGDERVTAIGRFIRRTSIDELPQLINVLKGDMSLVGPRPHAIGMRAGDTAYERLVPYYHARHRMKPGITGWAQANGLRGPTHDSSLAIARIDHDIAYIQNFSLWLDIKIMARTLRREFLAGSGI